MQTETMIGAKLAAKGITPRNVKFQIALAEFQNNGGTWTDYLNIGRAAYGKGSEGQPDNARQSQNVVADASRKNESDSHPAFADKAISALPSLSAERNGAGQIGFAEKASPPVPRPVSSAKAKRGMAAIASIQSAIAISLFDSVILPDGRKIADVSWYELPKLAASHRRLSRIAMLIYHHAIPTDQSATARQILKEEDFGQIIEQAERFNDIV